VTFAVLTGCAMAGVFRIKWARCPLPVISSVVACAITVVAIRGYLESSFINVYPREKLITHRQLLHIPVDAEVLEEPAKNPQALQEGESRIDRIRRLGVIRIGFDPREMPFSYFHGSDLVGHDIDMAHRLARDLGVTIEFVPFRGATLIDQLVADHFDVAMSGLQGTVRRATKIALGDSYMDTTLALVVLDHRKGEFDSLDRVLAIQDLKLAVVSHSFFDERIREAVPHAEIVEFDSEQAFFDSVSTDIDALLTSAETGSAWTLRRPKYTVVNPLAKSVRIPLYYMTVPDAKMSGFLKSWLELRRKDGTLEKLYDYWILGIDQHPKPPRWCILRDVLHWVP